MIRLRTFVILSSLLVVLLVLLVSWGQMKRALDKGAATLREKEMEHISQVALSVIETKKSELNNYTRVIRSNNDLASAYIIALESGDTKLIDTRLKKIRKEVNFDFAEILTPKGKPIHKNGLEINKGTLNRILSQKEGLCPAELFGEPALISFSPLTLYDEPIGIVVIGYYLQRHVSPALATFTGAEITFKIEPAAKPRGPIMDLSHSEFSAPLDQTGNERLWTKIHLKESPSESLWALLSSRLILSGAISLVLLFVVLNCFLEFGFVRQFRGFVEEMNKTAQDVDRGEPREIPFSPSHIEENNFLFRSSQALVRSLIAYQSRMKTQVLLEEEGRKQRALGQLAQQVAHDIRSPLSALAAATDGLAEVPEQNRLLIRGAVSRIQDIANELIAKRKEMDLKSDVPSVQLLSSLIETIISEKRMQRRQRIDIHIETKLDESSYGLFGLVQPNILKTVLSNILDNAVDAMPKGGEAYVCLKEKGENIEISVEDTGSGISKDLIPELGQRGKSFNKPNGSGLGLFHARMSLEAWGGSLSVHSELGRGTQVRMLLPKATPPRWFVPNIEVSSDQPIVIVDDDVNIHQIWHSRFAKTHSKARLNLFHFSTLKQLSDWKAADGNKKALCLIDYEFLGEEKNGLSLIEALGIEDQSILVTSRYEEPAIIEGCLSKNIGLVPKTMAGFVPIVEAPHAV